ncbi:MAG: hypothetical protein ACETWM_21390 [Candidatus Lokiarchaeia archaeon]
MWFPDEHRVRKIKMDLERVRELGVDSVRAVGWLTDFVINVQIERLREKYPDRSCREITEILRRILFERGRNEF